MNELAQILVAFNDKAQKEFFSLYEKFKGSVKQLDRTKDDNVFQQQQGKYMHTLKRQLESLALELLDKNKSLKGNSQLNKKLTDAVNMYLTEFRQKSRSL